MSNTTVAAGSERLWQIGLELSALRARVQRDVRARTAQWAPHEIEVIDHVTAGKSPPAEPRLLRIDERVQGVLGKCVLFHLEPDESQRIW